MTSTKKNYKQIITDTPHSGISFIRIGMCGDPFTEVMIGNNSFVIGKTGILELVGEMSNVTISSTNPTLFIDYIE